MNKREGERGREREREGERGREYTLLQYIHMLEESREREGRGRKRLPR